MESNIVLIAKVAMLSGKISTVPGLMDDVCGANKYIKSSSEKG